ncbi:uncharacterized protein SCODWIG_00489 [Saccharomycodes ludwigii]|uniref:Protein kinase domain-containing protein n=1 Tax=Saccharomycodes ludwigii TaxID=36035 RepID=A0A376B220_9ASCO|nr:hypothetical protein SCDLUD_000428 [Saccharomycodes ludwigii]KAH3902836.1 hypothetical protein SCDLUD_000428 [Saccharomycodes ludwigii]SSD58728.1 uncharacterized protein SCODWIG_00489 [Saccharomycodes ludwigii]
MTMSMIPKDIRDSTPSAYEIAHNPKLIRPVTLASATSSIHSDTSSDASTSTVSSSKRDVYTADDSKQDRRHHHHHHHHHHHRPISRDDNTEDINPRKNTIKKEKSSLNPLKLFHKKNHDNDSSVNNTGSTSKNKLLSSSVSRSPSFSHGGANNAYNKSLKRNHTVTHETYRPRGNTVSIKNFGVNGTGILTMTGAGSTDSLNNTEGFNIRHSKSINGLNSNPFINDTTGVLSRKPTSSGIGMMQYNPYGTFSPNAGSGSGSSHDLGFYLTDGTGESNLLPLPIENPNDFLPPDLKQLNILLTDDFVIASDRKSLGKGASSDVRQIISKHRKKKVYALKKFCLFNKESPKHFYERCSKEYIIAKTLSRNKHIATTYYLMKIPTTSLMSRGWGFVMEYCTGGDLFNLILRPKWKKDPAGEKFCLFKQISLGIRFMHKVHGIAHRDIKPENVLLTENGVAKLTDFGVSEYGYNDPNDLDSGVRLSTAFVGSPPYTSPEVMLQKTAGEDKNGNSTAKPYDPFKMDCWSLGVVFFAMMYQCPPFTSAENTNAHYRDFMFSYDSYTNRYPEFKAKMNPKDNPKSLMHGPGGDSKWGREFQNTDASRVAWKLVDPNPETRYTIDDVFYDPWFQKIETCTLENNDNEGDDREGTIDDPNLPILTENIYDNFTNSVNKPTSNPFSHRSGPTTNNSLGESFSRRSSTKSMLDIAENATGRGITGLKMKKSSGVPLELPTDKEPSFVLKSDEGELPTVTEQKTKECVEANESDEENNDAGFKDASNRLNELSLEKHNNVISTNSSHNNSADDLSSSKSFILNFPSRVNNGLPNVNGNDIAPSNSSSSLNSRTPTASTPLDQVMNKKVIHRHL